MQVHGMHGEVAKMDGALKLLTLVITIEIALSLP